MTWRGLIPPYDVEPDDEPADDWRRQDVSLARSSSERDRAMVAKVRRLRAELDVLELFDRERRRTWRDFGNGQRAKELIRRRGELEAYPATTNPTSGELAAAFERVGRPRLERTFDVRTAEAWRAVERAYGRSVH